MNWNGKKVLVSGAGGFIGSHLCEALLNEGAHVTAMLRYTSRDSRGFLEDLSENHQRNIEFVSGNVEDHEFVRKHVKGKTHVFHLAALIGIPYSYVAPQSYVRTNIEGTLNFLEAVKEFGVERMVHTSTSESYGTAQYTPIDEKHPLQGQSPYSATKIAADKIVESYFLSFQTPVSILRPFNTYGPRQSARAIIPTIISQALVRKEIKIGNGTPVRDFVYVKDTVDAFLKNASSPDTVGKPVHTATGEGINVHDLASKILKILGIDKPIVTEEGRLRPEGSEVFKLIGTPKLAEKLMGWKAQTSLDDGLQKTIEFIRQHPDLYRPDSYTV